MLRQTDKKSESSKRNDVGRCERFDNGREIQLAGALNSAPSTFPEALPRYSHIDGIALCCGGQALSQNQNPTSGSESDVV
jgi:hypothetical protein